MASRPLQLLCGQESCYIGRVTDLSVIKPVIYPEDGDGLYQEMYQWGRRKGDLTTTITIAVIIYFEGEVNMKVE